MQHLAVIRCLGERVVPLAVQPSLQLLCRWQLVIFWELQLLFLEQQIEYLLCLGHVKVKAFHKPLLFDPLARDGVCPPGPLCHSHFLFPARIIGIICLGHVYMALEFFLV